MTMSLISLFSANAGNPSQKAPGSDGENASDNTLFAAFFQAALSPDGSSSEVSRLSGGWSEEEGDAGHGPPLWGNREPGADETPVEDAIRIGLPSEMGEAPASATGGEPDADLKRIAPETESKLREFLISLQNPAPQKITTPEAPKSFAEAIAQGNSGGERMGGTTNPSTPLDGKLQPTRAFPAPDSAPDAAPGAEARRGPVPELRGADAQTFKAPGSEGMKTAPEKPGASFMVQDAVKIGPTSPEGKVDHVAKRSDSHPLQAQIFAATSTPPVKKPLAFERFSVRADEPPVKTAGFSPSVHADELQAVTMAKESEQPANNLTRDTKPALVIEAAVEATRTLPAENEARSLSSAENLFSGDMKANREIQNPSSLRESFAVRTMQGEPASEEGILNQVVEKIRFSGQDKNSLTLRLHPESLGHIRVDLSLENEQVKAHLHAQNQQVQEILEKNLPRLREALEQQGLKLGDVQVSADSHSQGGGQRAGGGEKESPWRHSWSPGPGKNEDDPPALSEKPPAGSRGINGRLSIRI